LSDIQTFLGVTQPRADHLAGEALRPHAMTEQFDAIVVGSGIGGLTAARLFSWFGRKRVLVLEQHTTLGGLTHVFSRPRSGAAPYEFATGIHYLGLNAECASLPALLAQLSENRLQWQKLPDPFDIIAFPRRSFAIPDGESAYKAALAERFPTEKAAIERYFRDIRRAARGLVAACIINALPRSTQPLALAIVRRVFALAFERTGAYLERTLTDPALRSLLAAQWGNYGQPPSVSAFGIHAIIVLHYIGGAIYPLGGPARIGEAMLDLLHRDGSDARLGQRVDEIIIEGGRAVGVDVVDVRSNRRYQVRAPIIVSDAGLRNTLGALLPACERARFADALALLANNSSGLVLFVGLESSPAVLGLSGANHWVFPGESHEAAMAAPPGEGMIFLSFPSLKNPAAANHTVEVVCPVHADAFRAWAGEPWPRQAADYLALKQRLIDRLLERIEAHLPGFRNLVAVAELATPLTFTSFQHSPEGAFYGLACTPERLLSPLTSVTTPIPGLFLSGQDTATPGIMGAAIGGILAASAALPLGARGRMWRTFSLTRMPPRASPAVRAAGQWKGYLKVAAVTNETPSVKSFRLEDPDGGFLPFVFAAGQFLTFTLPVAGGAVRRCYSITSPACETRFCTIAVKRETYGLGSHHLHDDVAVGRCLKIEGPSGHFTLPDGKTEEVPDALLVIAGGIGIAPLISVLRQLRATRATLPVTVIACFRTCKEILFREELMMLPQGMPNVAARILVEEPDAAWSGDTGRPSAALIAESAGATLARARIHLCGPRTMMEAVKLMLTELVVPHEHVHTEDFEPLAGDNAARDRAIAKGAGTAGARIRVYNAAFTGVGRTVHIALGQSLLDAALAEGVPIGHTCGAAGACGDCRVRVGEGSVETEDPNNLLTKRERSQGWVLACQTYPTGDVTVEAERRRA
jgi:ferredoxin-NADP reductase/phytoene dehydrogenase-like protein